MVLTDERWAALEPLLEGCRPKGRTPPRDLRRTVEAIVWRHANGAKWRAAPARAAGNAPPGSGPRPPGPGRPARPAPRRTRAAGAGARRARPRRRPPPPPAGRTRRVRPLTAPPSRPDPAPARRTGAARPPC